MDEAGKNLYYYYISKIKWPKQDTNTSKSHSRWYKMQIKKHTQTYVIKLNSTEWYLTLMLGLICYYINCHKQTKPSQIHAFNDLSIWCNNTIHSVKCKITVCTCQSEHTHIPMQVYMLSAHTHTHSENYCTWMEHSGIMGDVDANLAELKTSNRTQVWS